MVGPLRRGLRPMSRTLDRRAGTELCAESVQSQSRCDRSAHLTRVDASKSKKQGGGRELITMKNTCPTAHTSMHAFAAAEPHR